MSRNVVSGEHQRWLGARTRVKAEAGRAAALRARVRGFLATYGVELALVVSLAALALFVCFVRLAPIDNGGDPLDHWYFVRQWAYDNDPSRARLDHHASRFGIHWITWVAQALLGPRPRAYFAPGLFAAVTSTVLTYGLGRLVSGRWVGIVAALLLLESGQFVQASSQLYPGVFQTMYALAAAVCLVRFIEVEGRTADAWLLASALFVFAAYLSHEPSAFLVPGMMLAVWLKRRSVRDFVVFAGMMTGFVIAETAAYATFTRYWGRVDVLQQAALTHPTPARTVGYLLERFTRASDGVKFAYYPFFVAGPALLVFGRRLKAKAVVLVAASFLLLVTFFVRRVDPIVLFLEHGDRYIVCTMPFAFVATAHGVAAGVRALLAWTRGRRVTALSPRGILAVRAGGFVLAAALMAVVGWRASERARKIHPFRDLDAIEETLNDTYRRQLPIIGKVSARARNIVQVRALHWAHKGFLKDELLVVNGRLPDFKYGADLAALGKNERYMPDVPDLDAARVRELERRGCALRLTVRGSVVELSRKQPLPARCKP